MYKLYIENIWIFTYRGIEKNAGFTWSNYSTKWAKDNKTKKISKNISTIYVLYNINCECGLGRWPCCKSENQLDKLR